MVTQKLHRGLVAVPLIALALLTGCSDPFSTAADSGHPTPTISTVAIKTRTAKTLPGSGEVVTDKYGSYEHVAPTSSKFDSEELVDSTWKTAGFTRAEVLSARKWVLDFVTTQAVDSSAVDGDRSQWKAWVRDEAPKYVTKDELRTTTQDHKDGSRSLIVYNNPLNAITPTTRDGGVRLTEDSPYVNSITGYATPYDRLQVEGNVIAKYRVAPASALAALKKARPKMTEAELRKKFPRAFNAAEDELKLTFDFIYSVRKHQDSWRITGYYNQYKTKYSYN